MSQPLSSSARAINSHPRLADIRRLVLSGVPDSAIVQQFSDPDRWPQHQFTWKAMQRYRESIAPLLDRMLQERGASLLAALIEDFDYTRTQLRIGMKRALTPTEALPNGDLPTHLEYIDRSTTIIQSLATILDRNSQRELEREKWEWEREKERMLLENGGVGGSGGNAAANSLGALLANGLNVAMCVAIPKAPGLKQVAAAAPAAEAIEATVVEETNHEVSPSPAPLDPSSAP